MKKFLLFTVSMFCFQGVFGNSFGIGGYGSWSLGYGGFDGALNYQTNNEQKKINKFSNSFSTGGFLQYSFLIKSQKKYIVFLSVGYSQREIDFCFEIDDQTKNSIRDKNSTHSFVQKGMEVLFKNYYIFSSKEYIDLGFFVGLGCNISKHRFITKKNSHQTKEEEDIGKQELSKFNAFPILGFAMPFLGEIGCLDMGIQYFLFDQAKNAKEFKKSFGEKVSIGKKHISFSVDLKINFWELIRG